MKSINELNPMGHDTSLIVRNNLQMTFDRVMELQDAWLDADPSNEPFTINSGLRSYEHQARLIADGLSNAKHSKHLAGLAVDIADPDGKIAAFFYNDYLASVEEKRKSIMEIIGLWAEHPKYTKTWFHVQCIAPGSLKRFFIP